MSLLVRILFGVLTLTIGLGLASPAQITNSDIVSLFKAGLAEGNIILEIEQSRGNFDTSPNELVALKKQGVSDAIIKAMLEVRAVPKRLNESSQKEMPLSAPQKSALREVLNARKMIAGPLAPIQASASQTKTSKAQLRTYEAVHMRRCLHHKCYRLTEPGMLRT